MLALWHSLYEAINFLNYFSPSHPCGVTKPFSLKLATSEITSLSMAQKGES